MPYVHIEQRSLFECKGTAIRHTWQSLFLGISALTNIAVAISLSPMILLLFGMAETISGVAVRNRVIQAAGVVTGAGGIVLYYILGSLSESGVETTLLFTLAGIVLVLTGVILQVQNKQ